MKRILSVMLAGVIAFTTVCASIPAAAEDNSALENSQTSVSRNISVASTNSLGSILAEPLQAQVQQNEQQNKNRVFELKMMTENVCRITYQADDEYKIVVAVFDDKGERLLTSAESETKSGYYNNYVTFDADAMPDSYVLRAYIVNKITMSPVTVEYTCEDYTSVAQEFWKSTVDDYPQELVINLDEDKTNNFLVVEENVNVVTGNGVNNILVSADEENRVYTFSNIDEKISSLSAGDMIFYQYDTDYVVTKIKSLEIFDTEAILIGEYVRMSDVFSVVKINEEASTKDIDFASNTKEDNEAQLLSEEYNDSDDTNIQQYSHDEEHYLPMTDKVTEPTSEIEEGSFEYMAYGQDFGDFEKPFNVANIDKAKITACFTVKAGTEVGPSGSENTNGIKWSVELSMGDDDNALKIDANRKDFTYDEKKEIIDACDKLKKQTDENGNPLKPVDHDSGSLTVKKQLSVFGKAEITFPEIKAGINYVNGENSDWKSIKVQADFNIKLSIGISAEFEGELTLVEVTVPPLEAIGISLGVSLTATLNAKIEAAVDFTITGSVIMENNNGGDLYISMPIDIEDDPVFNLEGKVSFALGVKPEIKVLGGAILDVFYQVGAEIDFTVKLHHTTNEHPCKNCFEIGATFSVPWEFHAGILFDIIAYDVDGNYLGGDENPIELFNAYWQLDNMQFGWGKCPNSNQKQVVITLYDSETGNPIADTDVEDNFGGGYTTNSAGVFSLYAPEAEDNIYKVTLTVSGYYSKEAVAVIPDDAKYGTTEVSMLAFRCAPQPTLYVRVYDNGGNPVKDAVVDVKTYTTTGQMLTKTFLTSSAGGVVVNSMSPKSTKNYTVNVSKDGVSADSQRALLTMKNVTLYFYLDIGEETEDPETTTPDDPADPEDPDQPDPTDPVDPPVEKEKITTDIIIVTGSGANSAVVFGATVIGQLGSAVTDENGKASLTFYKGESSTITVKKTDYFDSEYKFIADGNQQTVVLYPVGINVTVTVVDPEGNPLSGALVASNYANGVTGEDGKATVYFPRGNTTAKVSRDRYISTQYNFKADGTPQTITLKPDLVDVNFRLRDPFDDPLPGASVTIEGNTVVTDDNGEAEITVFRGDNTYEIKCDDYTIVSADFVAGDDTVIDRRIFPEPNPASDFEYVIESDNTVTITKYIGTDMTVVVPGEIEELPVAKISSSVFRDIDVESIVFLDPPSDTYMYFDRSAVRNCEVLGKIYLPARISSSYYSVSPFNNCSNLTKVTFGEGITGITTGLFYGLTSLTSIKIPDTVTTIYNSAFANTSLETLELPSSLSLIERGAFSGTPLTELILPETTAETLMLENTSFKNCTSLTKVHIPAKISTDSWSVSPFNGCTSLTDVTFGEGITVIPSGLFNGVSSLTEINIPDTVTTIGWCTFTNTSLSAITIPPSVSLIERGAFSGTPLTELTLPETTAKTLMLENTSFKNCTSLTRVHIPAKISTNSWSVSPFNGCTSLTDVTFGEGITVIPSGLFNGVSSLTEINIPDTVTTIGWCTFTNTSLSAITIPPSVSLIERGAFSGTPLTELTLPETTAKTLMLENTSFKNCTSLTRVHIPAKISTDAYSVSPFNGCTSLTDITFGEGITVFPQGLFCGVTSLPTIDIPASVRTLSRGCLYDVSFDSLTIPSTVVEIDSATNNITTIYGVIGSAAEKYANDKELTFIPISDTALLFDTESTNAQSFYSEEYYFAAASSSAGQISKTFRNLAPGVIYNIYAVKDNNADDVLASDNLLYIAQRTANQNGNIKISCVLRENCDDPQFIIKSMGRTDIANAEIIVPEIGDTKLIEPLVICNNELLNEEIDYLISGSRKLTESGGYEFAVIGINDYYGTNTVVYEYNAPDVSAISLISAPDKTSYKKGEKLDLSGSVLSVTYSDDSTCEIELTESMVTGFDSSISGTQTITVTYGGKTCTFTITVKSGSSGGTSGGGGTSVTSDNSASKISATLEYRNIGRSAQPGTLEKVTENNRTFFKAVFESHAIGCWANLMKNNGDKPEFISAAKIQNDGSVLLPFGEAEKYIVIVDKCTYLTGDANDDLLINALDASAILKHIVGIALLTENQLSTLDCNGDGTVNALDASRILKKVVGLIA